MTRVGSGWFERRSTKRRTDDYPFIDVRKLECKAGLDENVVIAGGARAVLEWRQCHFGGYRPYFRCPRCTGRCCILYRFRKGGMGSDHYGCQKCLSMIHPVENEGKIERAMRRSNKAIRRQNYDATKPEGKPLWMRWPTWKRLSDQVAESFMARFEYHDKSIMLLRYLDSPKQWLKRNK